MTFCLLGSLSSSYPLRFFLQESLRVLPELVTQILRVGSVEIWIGRSFFYGIGEVRQRLDLGLGFFAAGRIKCEETCQPPHSSEQDAVLDLLDREGIQQLPRGFAIGELSSAGCDRTLLKG